MVNAHANQRTSCALKWLSSMTQKARYEGCGCRARQALEKLFVDHSNIGVEPRRDAMQCLRNT